MDCVDARDADLGDGVSDEVIWARVLAGDALAYGLIWDRHRAGMQRRLAAIADEPGDAEDLLAVVFLELWRKRASVRFVDGSLLPWLIVVARNVNRNALRARRRHRAFLDRLPAPRAAADPADSLADADPSRMRRLRAALAAVRPVDRDLLALTALEGRTVAEAATLLGMNEGAARMRLSRLRTRLRGEAAEPTTEGGVR